MKNIQVCVGMDADGQLIIKNINEVYKVKGRDYDEENRTTNTRIY